LLNLPHITVSGLYHLRFSQNLLIFAILYISLGIETKHLYDYVIKKIKNHKPATILTTIAAILIILANFTLSGFHLEKKQLWLLHPTEPITVNLRGKEILAVLPDYMTSNYNIIISNKTVANGFYIASHGTKLTYPLFSPLMRLNIHSPGIYTIPLEDDTLFIDVYSMVNKKLVAIYYSNLHNSIIKNKIKYIIVTNQDPFENWAKKFPGLRLHKKVTNKRFQFQVYEITDNWPEKYDGKLYISDRAKKMFEYFKQTYPDKYSEYLEKSPALEKALSKQQS
jgi:hypothetical protein